MGATAIFDPLRQISRPAGALAAPGAAQRPAFDNVLLDSIRRIGRAGESRP
jgi:hypothetical protein